MLKRWGRGAEYEGEDGTSYEGMFRRRRPDDISGACGSGGD